MIRRLLRLGGGRPIRPSYDPGMARKMGPAGFAALPDLVAGRPVDVDPLLGRAAFVDSRIDCADFRALTLIRVLHADRVNACRVPDATSEADAGRSATPAAWRLPPEVRARITDTLAGFRYSLDVPGDDSMCLWSENHQVVVAVAEHGAGLALPRATFSASGLSGAEHAARAAERLRTWLSDRFRIGYIEWLSPTYYEEDAAALAVLIDITDDDDLREQARGALDLLVLDLALHSVDGVLVGSAGRAYGPQKQQPRTQEVAPVIAYLLGEQDGTEAPPGAATGAGGASVNRWSTGAGETSVGVPGNASGDVAADRLGGLVRCSSYRAPAVARALVSDHGPLLVRQSFGLDLAEVADYVGPDADLARTGLLLWAMESFTEPESVRPTMELMARWDMWDNRFLAPLRGFRSLPSVALPPLVRAVDPATRGVSITRADVQTWRLGGLALSSAQHHNVGRYGDQQHLWQATLPGGVPVFATHPGRAMFDDVARNFSPSEWTGNGRHPDVGQDGQVLLALHRLGGRHGYLERGRHRWTHLFWPEDRFDRSERGDTWAVAGTGHGLVGVRTLRPARARGTNELVQAGDVTGWAVVVADAEMAGGFDAFAERVRSAELDVDADERTLRLRIAGTGGDSDGADPASAGTGSAPDGAGSVPAGHDDDRHDGGVPAGQWALTWRGGMTRDGVELGSDYPRLSFRDTHVDRFPDRIVVRHRGEELTLTQRGRLSPDAPDMPAPGAGASSVGGPA